MFNINGWEIVIIGVLFILLFGPDRLPEVATQLGKMLREIKQMTEGATAELTRELELAAKELREAPSGSGGSGSGRKAAGERTPALQPKSGPAQLDRSILPPTEPPGSDEVPAGGPRPEGEPEASIFGPAPDQGLPPDANDGVAT